MQYNVYVVTYASCDAPDVDHQLISYAHIRSIVISTCCMMMTMMKVLCCDTLVVLVGFLLSVFIFCELPLFCVCSVNIE